MKYLVTLFAIFLPLSGVTATKKPISKPVTIDHQWSDYDAIIEAALLDVDKLQKQLDEALEHIKIVQNQLDVTDKELDEAEAKTIELQSKIDEETALLEQIRDSLNAQIKETEMWHQKQKECLEKLWFWRKIAIGISSLITLYGIFLILKAAGKLPI